MSHTNEYVLYVKVEGGKITTGELLPRDADLPEDKSLAAFASVTIDPLAGTGLLQHIHQHFAGRDRLPTIGEVIPRYWTASSDLSESDDTRTPAEDYAVDLSAKTPSSTNLFTRQGTALSSTMTTGSSEGNQGGGLDDLTQAEAEAASRAGAEQSGGVVAKDPAAYVPPVRESQTDPKKQKNAPDQAPTAQEQAAPGPVPQVQEGTK